jgi:hypothetical protein
MSLISAGSISLDSTFNFFFFQWPKWNKDHSALVNCGGVEFLNLR